MKNLTAEHSTTKAEKKNKVEVWIYFLYKLSSYFSHEKWQFHAKMPQ